MDEAEKKRLTARWSGEALREAAVLVLVFVPLDWYLGRQDGKISAALIAFAAAAVLFGLGVWIGYDGEWRRDHDGKPDVE